MRREGPRRRKEIRMSAEHQIAVAVLSGAFTAGGITLASWISWMDECPPPWCIVRSFMLVTVALFAVAFGLLAASGA